MLQLYVCAREKPVQPLNSDIAEITQVYLKIGLTWKKTVGALEFECVFATGLLQWYIMALYINNSHIVWNHTKKNEDGITLFIMVMTLSVIVAEQDFKSLQVFTGIYRAVEDYTFGLDCDSSQLV